MQNEKNKSTSLAGFLLAIFTNGKLFIRGGIAVLGLLFFIWLAIVTFTITLRWLDPPLTVKVKDTGAVVFSTQRSETTAVFLLSANGGNDSPWVNTGIELDAGAEVRIRASGKICLAFHRMNEAAISDSLPPEPWVGPEGNRKGVSFPPRKIRNEERERSDFYVAKGLAQGRLLGIISKEEPKHKYWRKDEVSKQIIDIGAVHDFKSSSEGVLWLTVNDIWLDHDMVDAYVIEGKTTPADFIENVVEKSYWNIWYDDNAGSFLVTIEFSS